MCSVEGLRAIDKMKSVYRRSKRKQCSNERKVCSKRMVMKKLRFQLTADWIALNSLAWPLSSMAIAKQTSNHKPNPTRTNQKSQHNIRFQQMCYTQLPGGKRTH